jgi:hypothetical protein
VKSTTVTVRLTPHLFNGATTFTLSGYTCEVVGVPMVVHRTISSDPAGEPQVALGEKCWTVTEPRSGMRVGHSIEPTRERAIAHAEHVAIGHGGRRFVLDAVEWTLARDAGRGLGL